mgnify:CR=1 FL=1
MTDFYHMVPELADLLDKYLDFDDVIDMPVDLAADLDINRNDEFTDLRREAIAKLIKLEDNILPASFFDDFKKAEIKLKNGVDHKIGHFLVEKIQNSEFTQIAEVEKFDNFNQEIWNISTMHPILSRIYDEFIEWRDCESGQKLVHEQIMIILTSCLLSDKATKTEKKYE